MAFFVIGGKPTCSLFLHVVHVANYLENTLPNFKVRIIEKKTGEFEPWLVNLNSQYKWNHVRSPIIWKELTMRGGLPHYVGGASEFWEYCYHYYGLQSIETPEKLNELLEDHLQYFMSNENKIKEESKQVRKIGIIQTSSYMLHLFLSELMQIPTLFDKDLVIRLYDITLDFEAAKDMTQIVLNDLEIIAPKISTAMFQAVEKIDDVVNESELLIIFGDFTIKDNENEIDWIARNMSAMYFIADAINESAKRNLKIIVATHGPVCFNATVLIDSCPSIIITNIIALTSDVGLGPLRRASEITGVPLSNLGGPPVWGYIGINEYVDLKSTVMYSEIYCPYQRAIKNKGESTLPLGEIKTELRFLCHLLDDVETIFSESNKRKTQIINNLQRHSGYSKIRSLVCLIKEWYSQEEEGNIISLGIISNGSFGIPPGLVFSQPAILENKKWRPFKDFPLMNETKTKIQHLVEDAQRVNTMAFVGNSLKFSITNTLHENV